MKAVLRRDESGHDIAVEEVPVPVPLKGQVLVKVMASPCNPSDFFFTMGDYGLPGVVPKPPVVPGLEGAGIVAAVGEGVDKSLVGKRVGVFCETFSFDSYHGNWAQYTIKRVRDVYVLKDQSMDFADACYLFVNPMTVMCMWHIIQDDKHTGVIQTAASSSLGRSLFRLCKRKGMPIINVVRRPELVKEFEAMGAKYTLNQNDPDFDAKLKAAIAEVKPSVCFDAVAGDLGGKIFHALPPYAHLYIYGGFSGKPLPSVGIDDTLYYQKQVRGFWLSELFPKISLERIHEDLDYVSQDIQQGKKDSCFRQKIVGEHKLEDFAKVLKEYTGVAASGKLIFRPNN